MDMAQAFGLLAELEPPALALRQDLAALSFSVWDQPVPPSVYPALLFLPLVAWASLRAAVATAVGIAVLAWLASTRLLHSSDAALGLLQFAAGLLAAIGMAFAAGQCARQRARLSESLRRTQEEMAAASVELDRERLWRRASADDRTVLDDPAVHNLIKRMTPSPDRAQAPG